jgi:hypothetical protein
LIGNTLLEGGPNALLVSNQATIEALTKAGGGPIPNFETGHFNALAGRDGWKKAPALVCIGQPEPSAQDLETTTRALFWLDAGPIAWLATSPDDLVRLPETARAVRMRDGSAPLLSVRYHPDRLADAVLTAIREAQLIQALGRGRPANRTEADPLTIYLLSPVVLPIPVDRLVRWSEFEPGPVERAWLRERSAGGVLPLAAAWLVERYRDLFPSERTAKRDLAKYDAKKGRSSYRVYTGQMALLAEYRTGAPRWSRALINKNHPDPEAALAAAVGAPLVAFRWVDAPSPPGGARALAVGDPAPAKGGEADPAPSPHVASQADPSPRSTEAPAPGIDPNAMLCGRALRPSMILAHLSAREQAAIAPAETRARVGSIRLEAWHGQDGDAELVTIRRPGVKTQPEKGKILDATQAPKARGEVSPETEKDARPHA